MRKKAKLTEQKVGFAHPIYMQQDVNGDKESLEQRKDSLAVRIRAGDRAAAAELVDIYYKQIYLFMRRLGHNGLTSEDLTQQSFLQAWQHISRLRDGKALNAWLYRLAANVSKLYWRRHKADRAVGIEGINEPQSREAGPDKVGDYEQLGRLKNAVGRLPEKLRKAVVLHYMQCLTIAEAAEAAGVRQGTFKSRLNRALEALRKQVISENVEL